MARTKQSSNLTASKSSTSSSASFQTATLSDSELGEKGVGIKSPQRRSEMPAPKCTNSQSIQTDATASKSAQQVAATAVLANAIQPCHASHDRFLNVLEKSVDALDVSLKNNDRLVCMLATLVGEKRKRENQEDGDGGEDGEGDDGDESDERPVKIRCTDGKKEASVDYPRRRTVVNNAVGNLYVGSFHYADKK